eukprot:10246896-Alexandrium_andersonii.AAC.1
MAQKSTAGHRCRRPCLVLQHARSREGTRHACKRPAHRAPTPSASYLPWQINHGRSADSGGAAPAARQETAPTRGWPEIPTRRAFRFARLRGTRNV